MTAPRAAEAGLTLVEVLVALALFAMIGLAGLSVLRTVIEAQERSGARTERLAALSRTMFLVTRDLSEATRGSLVSIEGGRDGWLAFRRGDAPIGYGLEDGALVRSAGPARQPLLSGVARLDWRFLAADGRWSAIWPPGPSAARVNPRAVEMALVLAGPPPAGPLRRLVVLPADPEP